MYETHFVFGGFLTQVLFLRVSKPSLLGIHRDFEVSCRTGGDSMLSLV